jgi:AcrR family transcriptional regulator
MTERATRPKKKKIPGGNGDSQQTRAAFVAAAKREFAAHGYDQTGLREIAAAAGADKRLITRYFGSKEQLFEEALRSSTSKFEADRSDYARFGRRFAERTFGNCELTRSDRLEFISLCIRSAATPVGKGLVRANVKQQIERMAANLEGGDTALRAALVLVVCFGTALVREVLKIDELVELDVEKAAIHIAPILQSLIDGPAPEAPRTRRRARSSAVD